MAMYWLYAMVMPCLFVLGGAFWLVGTFHTTVLTPSAVVSVKAFAGQFVYITHSGGKILSLAQFTGFHEFLTRLKQANSQVSMRGV
jgi:hypothetical protein